MTSELDLALAAAAVGVGAAAQSVSGIGFALVSGPLLFAVFGAREGVRVAVVLSMLVNIAVLSREHRAVMWTRVLPVLVTALAVTPLLVRNGIRGLSGAQPIRYVPPFSQTPIRVVWRARALPESDSPTEIACRSSVPPRSSGNGDALALGPTFSQPSRSAATRHVATTSSG